jgi:ketosteroid isomerase-like protein
MDNMRDQNRDTAARSFNATMLGSSEGYLRYVFTAQQELLQLSVNLLRREIETSHRLAGSRDVTAAFAACSDLMRGTVEDFTAAATRLLNQASNAGGDAVQNAQRSAEAFSHDVRKGTETFARKAEETTQAAVNQATAAMEQMSEGTRDAARAKKNKE